MPVSSAVLAAQPLTLRRAGAVILGAALVAVAAQVSIPLPGTPVPLTLQPLAVLLVGGLLGPALGAASMILYLALGAAGLPVFTPYGLPGLARLFGPTGGYLIAYPVAAFAVGKLAGGRAAPRGGRFPASGPSRARPGRWRGARSPGRSASGSRRGSSAACSTAARGRTWAGGRGRASRPVCSAASCSEW